MSEDFYQTLAKRINQTLSRKAITPRKIRSLVKEAKHIRQQQGVLGLWNFAAQLPTFFFTESEVKRLKQSPEWTVFTQHMIQILIHEGVITPLEARMLGKYI